MANPEQLNAYQDEELISEAEEDKILEEHTVKKMGAAAIDPNKVKRIYYLPDDTIFTGTQEEFNEARHEWYQDHKMEG